jgi:hypothetical protein
MRLYTWISTLRCGNHPRLERFLKLSGDHTTSRKGHKIADLSAMLLGPGLLGRARSSLAVALYLSYCPRKIYYSPISDGGFRNTSWYIGYLFITEDPHLLDASQERAAGT